MDKSTIYRKTGLGITEISAARRTVDFRLRPLLILVDGRRTVQRLEALLAGSGIGDEHLARLVDGGYIEPLEPQRAGEPDGGPARRFAEGQHYMIETATAKLGLMSFLFALRLEKCDSVEDLVALLPEFEGAIARRLDRDYARHCRRVAQAILHA